MTDHAIIVPADSMSGAEFFKHVFGDRLAREAEALERSQALHEHLTAVQATFRTGSLWDQIQRRAELKAEYEARLQAIRARYSEQLTETLPDPLLKRRDAA